MLEELVAGGAEGLLIVRDSAACEGRSLLRALLRAALTRADQVLVVLLEVPREQFEVGLSPSERERLQYLDVFGDPLGWLGPDLPFQLGGLGGLLEGKFPPGGSRTLVLDSLSWLVLREPLPKICRDLGGLLGGDPKNGPPPRVLALLHEDLHPPPLIRALGALAKTQLVLGEPPITPGAPRVVRVLRHPQRKGGVWQQDETFTLQPDGSLRCLGVTPQNDHGESPQNPGVSPTPGVAPLTFRLGLSAAERGARAAVTPPYLLSPPTISTLLETPGTVVSPPEDPEDFEDPDDDLDV